MDVKSRETREASRPQSLIPHVNRAAVTTLKPRGQAYCDKVRRSAAQDLNLVLALVKTTEAAQTSDLYAFHKLFETNDT